MTSVAIAMRTSENRICRNWRRRQPPSPAAIERFLGGVGRLFLDLTAVGLVKPRWDTAHPRKSRITNGDSGGAGRACSRANRRGTAKVGSYKRPELERH